MVPGRRHRCRRATEAISASSAWIRQSAGIRRGEYLARKPGQLDTVVAQARGRHRTEDCARWAVYPFYCGQWPSTRYVLAWWWVTGGGHVNRKLWIAALAVPVLSA